MSAVPSDRWAWLCSCDASGHEATAAEADAAIEAHIAACHPHHQLTSETTTEKADQ